MKKKMSMLLSLTLVMIMALMACSDTSGGSATQPTTAATTAAGQTQATTAASTEGTKEEVVIRRNTSYENATSWDPVDNPGAASALLGNQIFETLLYLDLDLVFHPLLALSWDVSDDFTTYTFHLREGVQFHGGYGEMTSEDVKFSFERFGDPEYESTYQAALTVANYESIETPDKYTVVFNLINPDMDFLQRLTTAPAWVTSKAAFDDIGRDGFMAKPTGTGAFQFDDGILGTHIEIVAFDEYWNGRPRIDRVTNTVISDSNTYYTAFENGELDMIELYYMDKVNEYKAMGFREHYIPMPQHLYVGLNMQLEPFTDPKVREALFYAFDPQYFVDELYLGLEKVPTGWIPTKGVKYALDGYYTPEYNPEKAKELLAEAGHPDGLSFTLWCVNDELCTGPALIAEQQLVAAGFNVELQLVDFNVFMENVRGATAPAWLFFNSTNRIAEVTIERWTSDHYPGTNWVGLLDEQFDTAVANAAAAKTVEEKTEYLYEAQRRVLDLDVIYSASTYGWYYVMQPDIQGVEMWNDLSLRFRSAYRD